MVFDLKGLAFQSTFLTCNWIKNRKSVPCTWIGCVVGQSLYGNLECSSILSWEKNVCRKRNYKKLFKLCLKAHCSWETCQICKPHVQRRRVEIILYILKNYYFPLLWDSEIAKYLEVALSTMRSFRAIAYIRQDSANKFENIFFWFYLICFREIWIHMVDQLYSLLIYEKFWMYEMWPFIFHPVVKYNKLAQCFHHKILYYPIFPLKKSI